MQLKNSKIPKDCATSQIRRRSLINDKIKTIIPCFHVNSIIPLKNPPCPISSNIKIFKTHDPRNLSHLNQYGLDYSLEKFHIFDPVKFQNDKGFHEYINGERLRIVVDIDKLNSTKLKEKLPVSLRKNLIKLSPKLRKLHNLNINLTPRSKAFKFLRTSY